MRTSTLLLCFGLLSAPSFALSIFKLDSVALTRTDLATIEKLACEQPYHVRAESIAGFRDPRAPKGKMMASVRCAPHLIAADYRARYDARCSHRASQWTCEAVLFLQTEFMGPGDDDIILDGVTPDAAMGELRCLKAGLRQSPELLGVATRADATMLASRTRGVQKAPVIWAHLMTADKRCLTVSFEVACDANGQVPLESVAGQCFDE